MKLPALARCRGQTSREEIFFLLAQTAHSPQLCQRPSDFFFHGATLLFNSSGVEACLPSHEWQFRVLKVHLGVPYQSDVSPEYQADLPIRRVIVVRFFGFPF